MCVCACMRACVCECVRVCVYVVCVFACVCGGGNQVVLPPCGDPWELDSVMLSVRHGTRGVTTCGVPVPHRMKQTIDRTVRSTWTCTHNGRED